MTGRKFAQRWIYPVIVAILFMVAGTVQCAPLRACASDIDIPPFVLTSSSGFTGGVQNTGLAINVLQRALRRSGREPAIVARLPWRRCREGVAYGQWDIAIDVPTQELDAQRFLATTAYAEVHHVYFYSTKRHPGGALLHSSTDLKRYTVCGLSGSRFDAFGVLPDRQDTGSKNERNAINKIIEGRCDVFIALREVIDSLSARDAGLRDLFNSEGIRRVDLPGGTSTGLHFEFSRRMKEAATLQQSFNTTIRELIRNNEMARMTP